MRISTEENERPTEWLRRFQEDSGRYAELVEESGSLAIAAYRFAKARGRVCVVPSQLPTVTELMTAAREFVQRIAPGGPAPIVSLLLADCEFAKLPVIRPISDAA